MTDTIQDLPEYRTVTLPGLGRVQIPQGMTEAEVLSEILDDGAKATPAQKSKKKP